MATEQFILGFTLFLSGVLAALATFWLAGKFKRWLGGYTGDCLGATQQVSEIAFYLGVLASWE
jgi:adenosylcobinamide-GDP ribazoletransferase